MIWLALETLSDGVSAAVSADAGRIFERRAKARRQDERLVPVLDAALKAARTTLKRVEAIAVGTGPGRFTASRVGVTFANMLADSLGIPVFPVSLLEAFAARLARENFPDGRARLGIPAPREEFYVQEFLWKNSVHKACGAPFWSPSLLGARLPERPLRAAAVLEAVRGGAVKPRRAAPLYLKPANYAKK